MSDLIVYQPNPNISISLNADVVHHTVWATQKQIAQVLNLTPQTVGHHVANFKKARGDKASSAIRNFLITADDGKTYEVEHYNMTVITYIGFRAQATETAIAFQDWAGEQLDARIAELQNRALVLSPLEQLKLTVAAMEDQQKQLSQLSARVEHVEDTLEAADGAPQMMTVAAYAKWKNLRLADGELSVLGRKATIYSNANDYPVKTTPHAVYGTIHKYHVDVLKLMFSQRMLFEAKK
jgi:hypothetical protein